RIAEAKIVTEAVIALDAQHLTRSKIAHDERLTRIDAANEAMRAGIRKPGIQAYGAGIDRDFRSVREARFKVDGVRQGVTQAGIDGWRAVGPDDRMPGRA